MTLCFASSEDDGYPCSNLQTQIKGSSGWQSAKYCEYPQELGFFFDGEVHLNAIRILGHERKISSCVDVFIADATPEEKNKGMCVAYENASFTRLGHIKFSCSDEIDLLGRELKTIGIRRTCVYLKLLFSRPYPNGYNVFNQVGMIGISAYGNLPRVLTLWSNFGLSIPVSAVIEVPLDEMAPPDYSSANESDQTDSDAFVNTSTTVRLQKLLALKHKAIVDEDYDLAAALKDQIEVVKRSGKEIDKLEKAKAEAVREEDFVLAKQLKQQIEALRSAAYYLPVANSPLLVPTSIDSPEQTKVEAASFTQSQPAPSQTFITKPVEHDRVKAVGKGFYDMSDPSGGIVNTTRPGNVSTVPIEGLGSSWEKVINKAIFKHNTTKTHPDVLTGEAAAEGKSYEADFGVYAVACLLSRSGLLREAGIDGLFSSDAYSALQEHSSSGLETLLIYLTANNHGVSDPVAGVATKTCAYLQKVLTGKLGGSQGTRGASFPYEQILNSCILRLGDGNARVREGVEGVIVELANSSLGVDKVITALIGDPEKRAAMPSVFRFHVAKNNLLIKFVDRYGLSDLGPLRASELFPGVIADGLQHSHKDVRDTAMQLLLRLCKLDGPRTAPYLKEVKPAQLAILETLMNGQKLPKMNFTADLDTESSSAARRSRSASPTSVSSIASSSRTNSQLTGSARGKSQTSISLGTDADVPNHTCHFCRKQNPKFTESVLSDHYIRFCPMLCPCPLCDQVTEIATLQQHLVTECEGRMLVKRCPRCREAVQKEDLARHIEAKTCIPYIASHSVCPLCHSRFQAGIKGWLTHLTVAPGCVNNPRKFDGTGPVG